MSIWHRVSKPPQRPPHFDQDIDLWVRFVDMISLRPPRSSVVRWLAAQISRMASTTWMEQDMECPVAGKPIFLHEVHNAGQDSGCPLCPPYAWSRLLFLEEVNPKAVGNILVYVFSTDVGVMAIECLNKMTVSFFGRLDRIEPTIGCDVPSQQSMLWRDCYQNQQTYRLAQDVQPRVLNMCA